MADQHPIELRRARAERIVRLVHERLAQAGDLLESCRVDLLELQEDQLWAELGYRSWGECVRAEFGDVSRGYVTRLLSAARIARDLAEMLPTGNKLLTAPERQLRPLAALDSREQQAAAWEIAGDLAGDGERTTAHVEEAAAIVGTVDLATVPPEQIRAAMETLRGELARRQSEKRPARTVRPPELPAGAPVPRLYLGDARAILATLPAESVGCVVTSPPYWGLRDYHTAPLVWGGTCCEHPHEWQNYPHRWNPGGNDYGTSTLLGNGADRQERAGHTAGMGAFCEHVHEWGPLERGKRKDILPSDVTTLRARPGVDGRQNGAATDGGRFCTHVHDWQPLVKPAANGIVHSAMQGETFNGESATRSPSLSHGCQCGAWYGSLGLEPTPELYVAHLVDVFRQVWRVLRPDGLLWLVLGDAYAGSGKGPTGWNGSGRHEERQGFEGDNPSAPPPAGYKRKDLIGVPWMVAFALRADGWYLRSDVVWSKPAPMPESVADRPTRSHEYIFQLAKGEHYFYDADAIREPPADPLRESGRHRRDVWDIAAQPFPEPHYATYPEALAEVCIRAGAAPGSVVLDPFAGTGTTNLVATRLGHESIGVELQPDYAEMACRRLGLASTNLLTGGGAAHAV